MSVATSYANALYEAAKENSASSHLIDHAEGQLNLFLSVLKVSKEAQIALFSPVTTSKEKIKLVEVLSTQLNISPLVRQFIGLLAKKGRLQLLEKIRDSFNATRLEREGGVAGQLVAAETISESDIGSLEKAFSHRLGKRIIFRASTDPSLLAGMKVTVNGVTYDGTLRSQLQKLRDCFVAGTPGTHA